MQISLFYEDLRSFVPNPNACEFPEPPPTTTHHLPRNHGGRHHTPPFHPQKTTPLPRWMRLRPAAVLASLLCLNLWHSHSEGPPQVNVRWLGTTIHLRPEEQGQWRPEKQDKPHNNQSGCGRGHAGANNVWKNTTISRAGWIIQQKIKDKFIHLGQSSRPPSPENKHNNQPDRWREAESNEEGGWWGEEGGISSNTTHNNHRRVRFFAVLLELSS